VERCQRIGCTTFSQIATSTGTTYDDTGLAASTQLLLSRSGNRCGRKCQHLFQHRSAATRTRSLDATRQPYRRQQRARRSTSELDGVHQHHWDRNYAFNAARGLVTTFCTNSDFVGPRYSDTGLLTNTPTTTGFKLSMAWQREPVSSVATATTKRGRILCQSRVSDSHHRLTTVHRKHSGVTWSVDGVAGGSTASGTITTRACTRLAAGAGTHTVTGTASGTVRRCNR